MTENLSALEYKTQEEVLTVIRHITVVLSVSGVQVVDVLQQRAGNPSTQTDASQPVSIFFLYLGFVIHLLLRTLSCHSQVSCSALYSVSSDRTHPLWISRNLRRLHALFGMHRDAPYSQGILEGNLRTVGRVSGFVPSFSRSFADLTIGG